MNIVRSIEELEALYGTAVSFHRTRGELPSVGQIMQAITCDAFDGQAYDDAYPERIRQTLY